MKSGSGKERQRGLVSQKGTPSDASKMEWRLGIESADSILTTTLMSAFCSDPPKKNKNPPLNVNQTRFHYTLPSPHPVRTQCL